jgi:hypothetical protein
MGTSDDPVDPLLEYYIATSEFSLTAVEFVLAYDVANMDNLVVRLLHAAAARNSNIVEFITADKKWPHPRSLDSPPDDHSLRPLVRFGKCILASIGLILQTRETCWQLRLGRPETLQELGLSAIANKDAGVIELILSELAANAINLRVLGLRAISRSMATT